LEIRKLVNPSQLRRERKLGYDQASIETLVGRKKGGRVGRRGESEPIRHLHLNDDSAEFPRQAVSQRKSLKGEKKRPGKKETSEIKKAPAKGAEGSILWLTSR